MTRDEFLAIKPGDVLVSVHTRLPRLVLSEPSPTIGHGWTGVSLFKVKGSWTGASPLAGYDGPATRTLFEVTGRSACSQKLARAWYTWFDRVRWAVLAREPIPACPPLPRVASPWDVDEARLREQMNKWITAQKRGDFLSPWMMRALRREHA